jgi:hypothetical protein
MKRTLTLTASATVGVGAAALVIWLSPGLAGVTRTTSAARLHPVAVRDNKQPLTRTELARLVRWAAAWRACAQRRGLTLAQPRIADDEVVLAAQGEDRIRKAQFRRTLSCGDELGGPPPSTAFVLTRAGSLHLYRPRACLLPVKESA